MLEMMEAETYRNKIQRRRCGPLTTCLGMSAEALKRHDSSSGIDDYFVPATTVNWRPTHFFDLLLSL